MPHLIVHKVALEESDLCRVTAVWMHSPNGAGKNDEYW